MGKKNNLNGHKVILLVVDHYNPLGIVRSFGEAGIFPIVILVSKKTVLLNHCRYVGIIHRVDSHPEGYRLLMEKYGNEIVKPLLLIGDDRGVEELDSHFDELKEKFIFFNAGEQGRLHQLMNKDTIVSMAEEVGFNIPKSEVVNHGELPNTLRYPIITKTIMSIMGGWKDDVFICENEQELKEAYQRIKTPKLILQEFITKKTECCFEGFAVNGGKEVYIPFKLKYLRATKKSYGNYMTVEPLVDEALREKLYKLIRKTRFEGIFDVEFLQGADDQLYFLEVNFRTTTWTMTMTRGGVNAPLLWAKSMLKGHIDESEIHPRQDVFTAMNEPTDFRENVLTRKESFFKWFKEFKTCDCTYYWNKKDWKPFFHYLIKK